MSTRFSISDLAKEFGITPRAIRFYEEKGLLAPQRDGQTRWYRPGDRVSLKLILRGKRLGLSLEESGELIRMYQPGSDNEAQLQRLIESISRRREELRRQLDDIQLTLRELDDAEKRATEALSQLSPKSNSATAQRVAK